MPLRSRETFIYQFALFYCREGNNYFLISEHNFYCVNHYKTNQFHLHVFKYTDFCCATHTKYVFSKWNYPKERFLLVLIRFQNNLFVLIPRACTINTLLAFTEESHSHLGSAYHSKRKLSQNRNGQATLENTYNHISFYFLYHKGIAYSLETLTGFSFSFMQEGCGPRQLQSVLS